LAALHCRAAACSGSTSNASISAAVSKGVVCDGKPAGGLAELPGAASASAAWDTMFASTRRQAAQTASILTMVRSMKHSPNLPSGAQGWRYRGEERGERREGSCAARPESAPVVHEASL